MRLDCLSFAFVSSLSLSHALASRESPQQLSEQCWPEWPLTSVELQCSFDGSAELIVQAGRPVLSKSGSPRPEYGPWSYAPICSRFLSSLGSELCVYTSTSFSNGRGISIFTTPRIAEEFAGLPAFQDSERLPGINTFSGAWYTQELPGKGMGMLAKKPLKFGDQVTAYTPALLAHHEQELSTLEREKYFRIAISQLPRPIQDRYLKLATVYGDPRIKTQDIVKANTFELHVGGQNHLAVFPETARLNHACAPNAQYVLDPRHLTHSVHATRPIAPGEEITISYTSPLEPTDVRQRRLSDGFHFTCSCSRCSAKVKSDATLQRIQDMQKALNDWSPTSIASPKLAEKMLQIYRNEGLEGFLDIPYGFAALAYNAVGNSKQAVKYAKLAQKAILMKDGPWTPNMQVWNELLENPKNHWSFEMRSH